MLNKIFGYLPILLLVITNLSLSKERLPEVIDVSQDRIYQAYQHFVNGDLQELSGNPKAAVEEYRAALELNPSLHEARYHLAQILYRLGEVDQSLEQALQLPMETTEQLKLVAGLYLAKRNPEEAKKYFLRVAQKDSTDINALYSLAQLYQRQNQNDSAVLLMKKVSELAPPSSETHQEIGEYFLRLGQFPEATAEFQRAIELDSTNSKAYAGLGLAYERQRQLRDALNIYLLLQSRPASNPLLYQKIIGLYHDLGLPDSAVAQAKTALFLFPEDLNLEKILGGLYFSQKDYVQSESVFTSLSKSNPTDVDVHIYLGRIALAQKDYLSSESHFRQVLDLNDSLMEAWFSLAAIALEQGKYEEAASIYQASLKKTSDTLGVYFAMGAGYGRAKKYSEAEKYFLQALQLKPEETRILLALGNLHQQQDQADQAEKYFLKVLELEPNHATALNNLGYLWTEQGVNLDKALEMITRALQQEPNNSAFLDSYGWILFKLGRIRQAEENLNKSLELLKDDPEVFHHLGDLYYSQGKLKLARENWEKASQLDPDNPKLKKKLSKLK